MSHEIRSTHRDLTAWLRKQTHSHEAMIAGALVLCGLWACANNNPIPHVIIEGLAKDVVALGSACGFRQ